jgi:hypothetical protein
MIPRPLRAKTAALGKQIMAGMRVGTAANCQDREEMQ